MPNGSDYLPPGTSYADIDAHFGGPSRLDFEDMTADKQRDHRLADPYAYGYCEECARETGELVPRLHHARRCVSCLENEPIDIEAAEAFLRNLDTYGITGAEGPAIEKFLALGFALLGDAKVRQ